MTRRRSPGEGTVFRRADGRWQAARVIGYLATGNPRRVTAYGRTSGEALRKLEARILALGGVAAAATRPGAVPTLRAWVEQWLAHREAVVGVRASTLARYRQALDAYVLPELGHRRLDQIRPAHVQALLTTLAARPAQRRGGVLSSRTVRFTRTLLSSVLESAARLELIRSNPCRAVRAPRLAAEEPVSLTPAEVTALLATAPGQLRTLVYLAVATGLRRGELLALRWRDVSLGEGHLDVMASLSHGQESTPKTARSRRRVLLPEDVCRVLQQHAIDQAEVAAAAVEHGYAWQATGHVFLTGRGGPISERYATTLWHHLLDACAGAVRRVPFHALRHTHASLLLRSGVPVHVVSERLGHASATITLQVYAHALEDQRRAAALPLAELLDGGAGEVAEAPN